MLNKLCTSVLWIKLNIGIYFQHGIISFIVFSYHEKNKQTNFKSSERVHGHSGPVSEGTLYTAAPPKVMLGLTLEQKS